METFKKLPRKQKAWLLTGLFFVVFVIAGSVLGFVEVKAETVIDRESFLKERLVESSRWFCIQHIALLNEQIEAGETYNINVESQAKLKNNLNQLDNCLNHVADILKGDKVMGKQ